MRNELTMHPLIDKEKQNVAKKYRRDNVRISICSYAVSAVVVFVLLYFGISKNVVDFLYGVTDVRFFVIFFYFAFLYILYALLTFPLSFLREYTIEHRYGFSTQTYSAWLKDWVKSTAVSFILGAMIFEVLYLITDISSTLWWLWLSLIMIFFSVLLANLFPIIILPLFYKTTPVENDELKEKISAFCDRAQIHIKGIFTINLSSKTTKANAAVVGLGNTKRILIGDTLLQNYSDDEILSVCAHEIIHYREHHIWWSILWQALITLVMFYVFYIIYPFFYSLIGFENISDIAAFPLFITIFTILSLVVKPITSALSRYYEQRADRGALDLTRTPDAFIQFMAKACNKQLVIAYPHPLIEWYMYSHPSPGNRIASAENWREKSSQYNRDVYRHPQNPPAP
jgi:STE24 endopeptidase